MHLCAFTPVARSAARHRQVGLMGETTMTAFASLVPRKRRGASHLGCVATLASAMITGVTNEVVRHVAALAVDARVKRSVLRGSLMARAARRRYILGAGRRWVRVMAAHARSG